MPDGSRCSCGSRTFYRREIAVTRSDGVMLGLRSIHQLECIRCEREWFFVTDGNGKAEMREIFHLVQADKEVMRQAVHEYRNKDGTEPYTFAALSEEDWKSYEEARPS